MPQAVTSTLRLYADVCILYQHKDLAQIEKRHNEYFENLCDSFVENKLSIHFGETKSILSASKRRANNMCQLNIEYKGTNTKQHSEIKYLGCVLDDTMSGEPMASKVINKINNKLKLLYRKNMFLTPEIQRMLCNGLFQPYSDYACPAWYPNLTEKKEKNPQVMQNKCIIFCLKLNEMNHVSKEDFRSISWLPTNRRVNQCINTITTKFFNNIYPYYLEEIFEFTPHGRIDTKNKFAKLKTPFCKINMGNKTISFVGPSLWSVPKLIKITQIIQTILSIMLKIIALIE